LREYGFKKLRFKNLDPAEVRAEVQAVTSPWNIALIGPPPSGPLVDHYYVWNKVLLAYTRCSLTHDEDKLIAISAIAKQIQLLAKDTYLAGLWRRYLPYHLLWATDQRDKHRIRSPKYCAPSWSWASMKGRIEPYLSIRPDSPVMIQVLEARVQTTTSDLMGQVCDGCLKIQGWLRTFSIIYDREDSVFRINTKHSGLGLLPESFAQFDENQQPDDHEWWFLPILPLGPWIQSMAMGLIMVETGNRDEYRRVGMFMAYDDSARAFRRPTYPIQPTQSNVTEAMETREHPNGVQRNIIVKVNSTGSKSQHSKGGDTAKVAPNHESPSIASQENRNSPQGSENFHSSHTGKSTALGEDKKLWSFLKRRKKDNKDSWQERVITIV
jgi:hypothetical protein